VNLGDDVIQISAGYQVAKRQLGRIFARVGIGHEIPEEPYWIATPKQMRKLLRNVAPQLLLHSQPSLIKYYLDGKNQHPEKNVDIDNAIMAIILDDLIGKGYYKLNHLSYLAHSNTFVDDYWPAVVERTVNLLTEYELAEMHQPVVKTSNMVM
jgi:hypothetical protein